MHECPCLLLLVLFLVELSWQKLASGKFRERAEGVSEVAPLDPTQGLLHCVGLVALLQSNVRSLGKRDDDYENERVLCERLNRTVITLCNHNFPSLSLSHSSSPT